MHPHPRSTVIQADRSCREVTLLQEALPALPSVTAAALPLLAAVGLPSAALVVSEYTSTRHRLSRLWVATTDR